MVKRVSITRARATLASLVQQAETEKVIELTRRGKPVGVLLSIREYNRLQPTPVNFWEAHLAFRERLERDHIEIEPEIWAGLRDSSPGREIEF